MPKSKFEPLAIENFSSRLALTSAELSSIALGGKVLTCSDEWFAPASDLIKVVPAASLKGQFGPKGALYDGWETRRHNPTYDWVVIRLGPSAGGQIAGFDIDTSHFNGNEAPEVEIYGLSISPGEEKLGAPLSENDTRWTELLPKTPCKPSSRHLFARKEADLTGEPAYTHIKLHMIPDGGIARFRVYGSILPPALGHGIGEFATTEEDTELLNGLDLAHVLNGGRVVYTSNEHFGVGSNVLLPGRGVDMSDGWETRRSRAKDHNDWLIIKLGQPGLLSYAEIDTAHFLGNYPESVELQATLCRDHQSPQDESVEWTTILSRSKTEAGKQHYFMLFNVEGRIFSHVKVIMHPDGGIKRVRIIGRRSEPLAGFTGTLPPIKLPQHEKGLPIIPASPAKTFKGLTAAMGSFFVTSPSLSSSSAKNAIGHLGARNITPTASALRVTAEPLTAEAYVEYGDVISSSSKSTFHAVNQGTAKKFECLSDVVSLYPSSSNAKPTIHLYQCKGTTNTTIDVTILERHQFTTQAFLPLSGSESQQAGYLIIVAKNGTDDLPDLATIRAFRAKSSQGIAYHAGIWHHPMIALGDDHTDFAVVVNESDSDSRLNCDEVFYKSSVAIVEV